MTEQLPLKDILASVDLDGKVVWDELSAEQQKSIVFFTLNRYISSVKSSNRELKEHYVLVSNERFNKNLFSIMSKHPKLTWQTACSCSHESKKIHVHEWIGFNNVKNKKVKFLLNLFPEMKTDDVHTLAAITTTQEIKQYCEDLGWDKKQINGIKF
jgi:hypothetical protein